MERATRLPSAGGLLRRIWPTTAGHVETPPADPAAEPTDAAEVPALLRSDADGDDTEESEAEPDTHERHGRAEGGPPPRRDALTLAFAALAAVATLTQIASWVRSETVTPAATAAKERAEQTATDSRQDTALHDLREELQRRDTAYREDARRRDEQMASSVRVITDRLDTLSSRVGEVSGALAQLAREDRQRAAADR